MAAMAVSPTGTAGIFPFPLAQVGHVARGRRRGDDLLTFTNQGAARVKQPGANSTPVSLPWPPMAGEALGDISAHHHEAAVPAPALPSTAAPHRPALSPRENQRENNAHQPEKHHVSRNGRFPVPKELPVSIFKVALKNTLKCSP